MAVLLVGSSALDYLRIVRERGLDVGCRAQPSWSDVSYTSRQLELVGLGPEDGPFHVLVPEELSGGGREDVIRHGFRGELPTGSFLPYARDILVASPAFMLLTLAREADELELALAASELCGSYVLRPDEHAFASCEQAITVGELRSYMDRVRGCYGAARVRRALRYVEDNAASPFETLVALGLRMPVTQGGLGCGPSELNVPIDVGSGFGAGVGDRRTRVIDIYYPKYRFGVEVDGSQHNGTRQADDDAFRDIQLDACGIREKRITTSQFASFNKYCAFGDAVRRALHKRPLASCDSHLDEIQRVWHRLTVSPYFRARLDLRRR